MPNSISFQSEKLGGPQQYKITFNCVCLKCGKDADIGGALKTDSAVVHCHACGAHEVLPHKIGEVMKAILSEAMAKCAGETK